MSSLFEDKAIIIYREKDEMNNDDVAEILTKTIVLNYWVLINTPSNSFNAGVNRYHLPVKNDTTSNNNLIESKSMAFGCL